MNKNTYCLVFNRVRDVLMAVSEVAKSRGKSTSRGEAHTIDTVGSALSNQRGKLINTINFKSLTFSLLLASGQAVITSNLAHADITADPTAPANQRPTILNAPNGVPLVNIQTPSATGVSRNTYIQFDVANQGVILNNSRVSAQTQLGGWVQGNPYMATGTARVILNEVNSANPSYLNGYVEVAGSRAQVVIANPAGISCNGCGFINANRATLTTGTPMLNGGDLIGYREQVASLISQVWA